MSTADFVLLLSPSRWNGEINKLTQIPSSQHKVPHQRWLPRLKGRSQGGSHSSLSTVYCLGRSLPSYFCSSWVKSVTLHVRHYTTTRSRHLIDWRGLANLRDTQRSRYFLNIICSMTTATATSKTKSVELPKIIEERGQEEYSTCSICMDTPEDRGVLDCVRQWLIKSFPELRLTIEKNIAFSQHL